MAILQATSIDPSSFFEVGVLFTHKTSCCLKNLELQPGLVGDHMSNIGEEAKCEKYCQELILLWLLTYFGEVIQLYNGRHCIPGVVEQ